MVHGAVYKPHEEPTPNETTGEEEKPKLLYHNNNYYVKGISERMEQECKKLGYVVKRHEKNGIAAHAWTALHRVNWSAAKVRLAEYKLCARFLRHRSIL